MISLFNKFLFLATAVCVFSSGSFADGLGSLLVSSEAQITKVYLDNVYIGETPVNLDKVQIGDHMVVGRIGDEIIFKKVVEIRAEEKSVVLIPVSPYKDQLTLSEGNIANKRGSLESDKKNTSTKESAAFSPELTSLSEKLTLKKGESAESEKNLGDKEAVETEKKYSQAENVPDITVLLKKSSESGTSLHLGYSRTSISMKTGYSRKSSSGISGAFGYDFNIFNLKTRLSIEGAFGDNGYVLPVTMNFLFGLGENDGYSQYFGMGAGIFFTDLVESGGTGYRAIYGLGPFKGDKAFLLEMIIDVFSNDQASMYKFTMSGVYRWGI